MIPLRFFDVLGMMLESADSDHLDLRTIGDELSREREFRCDLERMRRIKAAFT